MRELSGHETPEYRLLRTASFWLKRMPAQYLLALCKKKSKRDLDLVPITLPTSAKLNKGRREMSVPSGKACTPSCSTCSPHQHRSVTNNLRADAQNEGQWSSRVSSIQSPSASRYTSLSCAGGGSRPGAKAPWTAARRSSKQCRPPAGVHDDNG